MDNLHNSKGEPPSRNGAQSCILVGKDRQGHWVVKDQKGLRGGIFVDRARALKYAMHEITNRMQAVIIVPGILELDIGTPAPAVARIHDQRAAVRRVA
jgi:hypothetical protein